MTFLIVGQDVALEQNPWPLWAIAEAGHEIGNHLFCHEPWLRLYSDAELAADLDRAEEAIVAAMGCHPVGFRGSGFSLSEVILAELERRGYLLVYRAQCSERGATGICMAPGAQAEIGPRASPLRLPGHHGADLDPELRMS